MKYVRRQFVPNFTFSQEKAKSEMHFLHCDVEPEEILPLI